MKQVNPDYSRLWCICLLLLLLTACDRRKTDNPKPDNPEQPNEPGIVTEIGTVTGNPVSANIGAQGGSISAGNGAIQVTIPAGALTQTTNITIQPITNTSNAGVGAGYRITPHNVTFAKPVQITFNYAGQMEEVDNPKFLGIAYQHTDKIWYLQSNVQNDTVHKKIVVNTTHFSDWSLAKWISLTPLTTTVVAGGTVTISATRFVPIKNDDDLLAPADPTKEGPGLPVGVPQELSSSRIKSWQLNGVGKLQPQQSKANYTAPATVAGVKEVAVVCELKVRDAQVILLSHITIVETGIFLRMNNGPEIKIPGHMEQIPEEGLYVIEGVSPSRPYITMKWPGSDGAFNWLNPSQESQSSFKETSLSVLDANNTQYTSYYYREDAEGNLIYVRSGGTFTVDGIKRKGKVVTGTFTVTKAGVFSQSEDGTSTIPISGRFALPIR